MPPKTLLPGPIPQELGWNAIHLNQVASGWVRNVRIENADMGVYTCEGAGAHGPQSRVPG